MHANDTSREAKPGVWIFRGTSIMFLVGSAAAFVFIVETMQAMGTDWPVVVSVAFLPLLLSTAFVYLFVHGKAPSFFTDLVGLWIWKAQACLYKAGGLSRPPLFWVELKIPKHPKEFS